MLLPSVTTKPNYSASVVDRLRLYEQLERWQEARVIVIHAPAGYGKSTLVSRWLDVSGCTTRSVWLSLDEADQDPGEFVHSLAGALERLLPGLLAAMQPILSAAQSEPQRAVKKLLAMLWEGMADNRREANQLLVIDDIHLIEDSEAAALLAPILELGPPRLRFVLLTRRTASLPLTRLFANGQVIEVTAEELGFTSDEVQQYLLAHRLSFSAAELAQIVQRTEGWVLALQLALHSQRRHGAAGAFLGQLRGDSAWLAHFLTQEVLVQQSPTVRNFLLRTSILESFSAPLCAVVSGSDETYRLLSHLQQSELFLISLDGDNTRFRYHHLFRELLRHRLLETEGAAAVAGLHRRAATWLAEKEQLLPAIHHFLSAGDEEEAAALVERHIRPAVVHNPPDARRLFAALPPAVAQRRPRLMLERCLAAVIADAKDLAFHLQNAERALGAYAGSTIQCEVFEAELLLYRACLHFNEGNMATALIMAREIQPQQHRLDPLLVGLLEFLWMHLKTFTADEATLRRHGQRALVAFKAFHYVPGQIAIRRELAMIDLCAGRGAEASRELERIVHHFGSDPAALCPDLCWIHMRAAEHYYWQNRLDQALHHIEAAMAVASAIQDDEALCLLPYFHRLCALHSRSPAFTEQEPTADRYPRSFRYTGWQIRWLLATDRTEAAWEVAQEYQASLSDDLYNLFYNRAIPYLQAFIARGENLEAANPLLNRALAGSIDARDYPRQLQLLLLKAWQELRTGEEEEVCKTLAQVEPLVAKTGYVRMVLDTPAVAARLSPGDPSVDRAGAVAATYQDGLLTEREVAVLALLARDLTYREIAEELIISIGTVRTHVRHIYKKLSVRRRDQAIDAAHRLEILAPARDVSQYSSLPHATKNRTVDNLFR